jgi:uncharacterized protein
LIHIILALTAILTASATHAASFDCTKATTMVEKAICSDAELSKLDEQLMAKYKDALSSAPNAANLKNDQKSWLVNTRNKCQDTACLNRVYTERIAVLERSAGTAAPSSSSKKADVSWAGTWNRARSTSYTESRLEITEKTSQAFEFSISTADDDNIGEISGLASFTKDFASFKETEYGCKVEFRMVGKCIKIDTSEKCGDLGGMGVDYDGTYCKGKEKKQKTNYFVERGIFKNESEFAAFKKIVGKYAELFEESFQWVTEEDDLDHFNAKVSAGGVAGLFTFMEGIIMQRPNGMIYAAVIDGDSVRYFCNDPQYIKKLPKTIENWMDRFKEKKVVYAGSLS